MDQYFLYVPRNIGVKLDVSQNSYLIRGFDQNGDQQLFLITHGFKETVSNSLGKLEDQYFLLVKENLAYITKSIFGVKKIPKAVNGGRIVNSYDEMARILFESVPSVFGSGLDLDVKYINCYSGNMVPGNYVGVHLKPYLEASGPIRILRYDKYNSKKHSGCYLCLCYDTYKEDIYNVMDDVDSYVKKNISRLMDGKISFLALGSSELSKRMKLEIKNKILFFVMNNDIEIEVAKLSECENAEKAFEEARKCININLLGYSNEELIE